MKLVEKANTEGIKAYSKKKTEDTINKAYDAIKILLESNNKVNFNSVSVKSGITKSFLYNNKEIRGEIEKIRGQQQEKIGKNNSNEKMNNNHENRIKELEKIVEHLVCEVNNLKKKNDIKNGK